MSKTLRQTVGNMATVLEALLGVDPRGDVARPVVCCARCSQEHDNLLFRRFEGRDVWIGDRRYTLWATCPETGDPVLASDLGEEADV